MPVTHVSITPDQQALRLYAFGMTRRLRGWALARVAFCLAFRRFVRLTQAQFAQAMGISVHTVRNWEQGRRTPEGPALALLRIAAKHPRIIRENLKSAC